jgi:hypothetical protein
LKKTEEQVYNSQVEIFSGAAGSGGGVGYIPLRNGVFETCYTMQFGNSNTALTADNRGAFSAVNNYIALPFKLSESLTVNRFLIRISGATSPVMTVRGGVSQFDTTTGFPTQVSSQITFVTNAFQDLTTGFTAGAFTTFTFAADVTLSANTWYCAAAQVRAFTSGSLTPNTGLANSLFQVQRWPCQKARIGAAAETDAPGVVGSCMLGYFNGVSTQYYIGHPADGSSNLNMFTASTTNTQAGFKLELNLPVDEILINKIVLHQSAQNSGHALRCKIFTDLAGANAIGTSVTLGTTTLVTATSLRMKAYYFAPPVRIKPYKTYYVMWEVASGTATGTNPTIISRIGIDTQAYNNSYDSLNEFYYRANSADANFTQSSGFVAPVTIYYDTVRNTPRPHIGSF